MSFIFPAKLKGPDGRRVRLAEEATGQLCEVFVVHQRVTISAEPFDPLSRDTAFTT
jgi:hypothetical protein